MKTTNVWGDVRRCLSGTALLVALPLALIGQQQQEQQEGPQFNLSQGEPVYLRIHEALVTPPGGWPIDRFTVDPYYHLDLLYSGFQEAIHAVAPRSDVQLVYSSEAIPSNALAVDVVLQEWSFNRLFNEFRVIFFATVQRDGRQNPLGGFFGRGPYTAAGFYGDYRDFEPAVEDAMERFAQQFDQVVSVEGNPT